MTLEPSRSVVGWMTVALSLGGCGTNSGGAADLAAWDMAGGADGASPAPDGAAASDGGGQVLPSGDTTGEMMVNCPASTALPPGAICTQLTVRCPGIEDLVVTMAVTTPLGGTGQTVVLLQGGGGTDFFSHFGVANDLVGKGIRTVQFAWAAPWEISMANSMLAAACRPATLLRWAFANPHAGSRAAGFCALGQSGGSAEVAYALAHYGLGDTLDFGMMTAGPPFGRIDYGCAQQSYTGPAITECPGAMTPIQNAPIAYGTAAAGPLVNMAEGTTTCGTGPASPADLARWAADSVVSPGASYDYPRTPVSFWYCGNTPNETTGLGWFYNSQITSSREVNCVAGMCQGEEVYADPPTLSAIEQELSQRCMPNH
jgi:hypothetical protein